MAAPRDPPMARGVVSVRLGFPITMIMTSQMPCQILRFLVFMRF